MDEYLLYLQQEINVKVEQPQMKSEIIFQIPGNIPLSSQGQLIKVIYYLYIIPKIDTIFCVSDCSPHYFEIQINPISSLQQNSQNIPQLLQNKLLKIETYYSCKPPNLIKLNCNQLLNNKISNIKMSSTHIIHYSKIIQV
ncbi:hypothetical protein ABPG74_011460 [Tetrahymena malaccensis]